MDRTVCARNRLRRRPIDGSHRSIGIVLCVVTMLGLTLGESVSARAGGCVPDQPLTEALHALRTAGVPVAFSSALVRSEMKVCPPPRATSPRAALDALLAQHGLAVQRGPGGTLLVVRGAATTIAVSAASPRAAEPPPPIDPEGDPSRSVLASVSDAIDVTSSVEARPAPAVGVDIDRSRLERQPSARDPWSLLQWAPGVVSDRINVGGSETGTQARFAAPGTTSQENSFTVDGVNATDMAALGTSSLYYDFDQLEKVRISSGGSDVTTEVAGVTVALVTKRGADVPRGSARVLATGDAGPLSAVAGGADPLRQNGDPGNRVDRIVERGFELGGPLRAGVLWGWLAWSETEIDAAAVNGAEDDTGLDHAAVKLNVQAGPSVSAVASLVDSDKRKPTRGAGPERDFAATWRQRGPTRVAKLEGSWLHEDFVLSGELSQVDGGFELTANGGDGPTGGEAVLDVDGVWRNGMLSGPTNRDSWRIRVDGSSFHTRGKVDHELRFGGSDRRYAFSERYVWPGPSQAYTMACENLGTCGGFGTGDFVAFQRVGDPSADLRYQALWLQDRVRTRKLTIDVGLRFDRQQGHNESGQAAANPALPELLPAVSSPGTDGGFRWQTLSPRLGLVAKLGASWRLRSSLGRFAEQLGAGDVGRLNPLEEAEATFLFDDLNGDHRWQPGEPLGAPSLLGLDPAAPGRPVSPNQTDPGLRPEITDELVLGVERTLGNSFVVSLDVTLRRISDLAEQRLLISTPDGTIRAAQASDYQPDLTFTIQRPDGTFGQAPFFTLKDGLIPSGGTLLTNGERARVYRGVTLRLQRRLSDHWSLRAHVTYGAAEWRVPAGFRTFDDPTDSLGSGDNDGDLHAERTPGNDPDFLQSTWSASVEGRIRLAPQRRWGFDVAANLFAREGFPLPFYLDFRSRDGLRREAQVTSALDDFRTDAVTLLDLRLEKELGLGRRLGGHGLRAVLAIDVFNVLDERPALRREANLALGLGNRVLTTLAPRVARVGMRLRWH